MTEHELDLLADHAAGLLDGTPEGDAVAARLATDPEWIEVYRALRAAGDAVRADLHALPAERVPADVVARLDAALAAAGPTTTRSVAADEGALVVDLSTARAGASGRPRAAGRSGRSDLAASPARRRRTWQATGAVAAGVAVLAAAGLGLGLLRGTDGGTMADSSAARQEEAAAPAPDLAASPDGAPRIASGTDYSAAVADRVRALLSVGAVPRPSGQGVVPEGESRAPTLVVPPALARLLDPAELARCLAAVGAPGRALAVDYALFAGSPALVLVVPGADPGTVTAVVVGPSCGVGGPDERYRTAVTR